MLDQTIKFATAKHDGQFRKHVGATGTKIPYISHPLEVMKMLWKWGIDEEGILVAAICHDLVEDTKTTKEEISELFGQQAADLVDELTFIGPTDREQRAILKAEYMKSFATSSIEALVMKLADRFCNVADKAVVDQENARIYFKKADSLFGAMWRREEEIKKRFGEKVFSRIVTTYVEETEALERNLR